MAYWPLASVAGTFSLTDLAYWTALTLVVSAFPVVTPRGSVVSVSIAPILAAAILGGPTAAAIVGFVGVLELRELRRAIPWYGTLYNHCATAISAIRRGSPLSSSMAGQLHTGVRGPSRRP